MGCKCKDAVDLLVDYLEGDLSDGDCDDLEAHLDGCEPCKRFLATYRATGEVCRCALERAMPEPVRERLLVYLRRETKQS